MNDSPCVSVVIPTLDEADYLGALLSDLDVQDVSMEVIVADGGSCDETVNVAIERGATVVSAPRGRGAQMNVGREVARSSWLLFLHADSRVHDRHLVRRSLGAMEEAMGRRGDERLAGHFRLRFRGGQSLAFRYLEAKSALNRKHTTNGDQGLLIRGSWFDELGGFDERMPFLEDQRLGVLIHERGHWMTLPGTIETSARRFEVEGFGKRYFVMAVVMAVWQSGAEEFFELAPQVYAEQSQADELELAPIFAAIWATMQQIGFQRSLEAWRRVGAFSRENAWQPFLLCDVFLENELGGARPFLDFYDRTIEPLISHELADLATAGLAFGLVAGVLPALTHARKRC